MAAEITNACTILSLIKATSGRKDKENLLRKNDSPALRFLLETLLNPYLTYGVIQIERGVSSRTSVPSLEELRTLREQLATRKVTGGAAVALIQSTLGTTEMLYDLFAKELRLGVDVKSVNKVFPGFIPTFEVGLCEKFLDVTDGVKCLPAGQWYVEPKYDGLRGVFVINPEGVISVFSRNGKEIYNVEHIIEELQKSGIRDIMLDGELYGEGWNDSISIAHTQSIHADSINLKFHVFDILSFSDWQAQVSQDAYITRKRHAEELLSGLTHIKVAPQTAVGSYEEALKIYEDLLSKGYEGIVFKEASAPYPFGRSTNWLKLKPVETYDLKISGYEEGSGRHKGRLGAFLCEYEGVQVKVGGGYSDEQRQEFWDKRDEMVGTVIEIEAAPGKTKEGSLRWPIFIKVRFDKN